MSEGGGSGPNIREEGGVTISPPAGTGEAIRGEPSPSIKVSWLSCKLVSTFDGALLGKTQVV